MRECLNGLVLFTAQALPKFFVVHLYLSPPHVVCGVGAHIRDSETKSRLCGPNFLYRIVGGVVALCRNPYKFLVLLSESHIVGDCVMLRAQFP